MYTKGQWCFLHTSSESVLLSDEVFSCQLDVGGYVLFIYKSG